MSVSLLRYGAVDRFGMLRTAFRAYLVPFGHSPAFPHVRGIIGPAVGTPPPARAIEFHGRTVGQGFCVHVIPPLCKTMENLSTVKNA